MNLKIIIVSKELIIRSRSSAVDFALLKDGKLVENGNAEPAITSQDKTDDNEMISASSGSGFAVSEDGYVVTNHHVIEGCQKVLVHSKEQSVQAIIVTSDPQNDLALLKADFIPETVFPLSADRNSLNPLKDEARTENTFPAR